LCKEKTRKKRISRHSVGSPSFIKKTVQFINILALFVMEMVGEHAIYLVYVMNEGHPEGGAFI
jgi:hypothetical protein